MQMHSPVVTRLPSGDVDLLAHLRTAVPPAGLRGEYACLVLVSCLPLGGLHLESAMPQVLECSRAYSQGSSAALFRFPLWRYPSRSRYPDRRVWFVHRWANHTPEQCSEHWFCPCVARGLLKDQVVGLSGCFATIYRLPNVTGATAVTHLFVVRVLSLTAWVCRLRQRWGGVLRTGNDSLQRRLGLRWSAWCRRLHLCPCAPLLCSVASRALAMGTHTQRLAVYTHDCHVCNSCHRAWN